MAKKKIVNAEIVRKPSPDDMRAMLDRLVTDKIEQILAQRDLEQVAPAYRSRRIRPFHPGFERDKHALYFEKWGCQTCGRKNGVSHMCNARCAQCNIRFGKRMQQLEAQWVANHPEAQTLEDIDHLTRRLRTAQELLNEEELSADAIRLSRHKVVSAYRKRNVAEGNCSYCPRPLAPNSTHYCVECLGKKRDRKRQRRKDFKTRLQAVLDHPTRRVRSAERLLGEGEK